MKRDSKLGTLGFLVAVTTICSLALTVVAELTKDRRERLENFKLAGLICAAAGIDAPFTDPDGASRFLADCRQTRTGGYRLITPSAQPGSAPEPVTAVVFSFPGLWDIITAVMAVSPGLTPEGFRAGRMAGLRIVSHKETPGLGGRIEEEWFHGQFSGLSLTRDVRIVMGRKASANDEPGGGAARSEVDGITGATMTCRFLEGAINGMAGDLTTAFPAGTAPEAGSDPQTTKGR